MSQRRPRRARAAAAAASVAPRATPTDRRWIGLAVLAAVLGVGAALRVWLSFNDDGIFWPDEIYQSLEPAHHWVFGTGILPWEFIEGARNWAFPATIAVLEKIGSLVSSDPRAYLDLTRLALSAASVATAFASYRLARGYGAARLSAAAGAGLYALAAPAIYLAPRAFSETASALPAALGLAFALPRGSDRRARMIGAALIGIAVLFRLQNAVFAVGLLAALLWRRDRRSFIDATGVLAGAAAVYGAIDWVTWGKPFDSARQYIAVNLATPDLIANFGDVAVRTQLDQYFPPAGYYAQYLLSSMGLPLVVALVLGVFAWRRGADIWLIAIAFFAVHSLIPHKELRYVVPVLPLVGALAAIGIDEAARLARRQARLGPALAAVLVLACGVSAVTFRDLTFGQLGVQATRLVSNEKGDLVPWRTPASSAYDDPGGVQRLLLAARAMPDLCGIKVEAVLPEFQGGYTYLDRAVALYRLGGPPRTSSFFNYVIALQTATPQGDVRATDGGMALIRLGGTCVPDPAFNNRL
jgi:phosphatidylinositol glycan class B